MASSGTPVEGRDNIIGPRVYISGSLQIVLYTNTQDSLDSTTVLADLTQPTGETGYAPVTMNGVWSWTSGVGTYDHGTPDDIYFENTGGSTWTAVPTGAAMTDGTYILHFKDTPSPISMTAGKRLTVDLSNLVAP